MAIKATSRVVRTRLLEVPDTIKGPREVKIGFPRGKADNDIIERAIFNNFGTRGSGKGFKTPRGGGFGGPIPERPFMQNAMRNNLTKYHQSLLKSAVALVEGKATLSVIMKRLGVLGQTDVQNEIRSMKSPPNSPLTVSLKGSSNPLIDTGEMLRSVTYQVVK